MCLDVWTITQKLKHSVARNALQTLFQYKKAFQLMSVDSYGGFDFNLRWLLNSLEAFQCIPILQSQLCEQKDRGSVFVVNLKEMTTY